MDSHDVALVLGSGWAEAADLIGETTATLSADTVPGFHAPAVEGHVGTIRSVLTKEGKRALVLGARTHYYEGKGVRAVVHGVRTAAAAGCKTLVLTNGCGGLNEDWTPGTPVLISDHINLTATSPLEGATFVDLTDLYSSRIRGLAGFEDFLMAQRHRADAGGEVGHERNAEDLHARVAAGDGLERGGHAHQVRADPLGVLHLGRGFVVRAGELGVDAFVQAGIDLAGQAADPCGVQVGEVHEGGAFKR